MIRAKLDKSLLGERPTDPTALKEYVSKVKVGSQLVDDLNERFSKWYFVISGFGSLRPLRADIVKAKER
jgi:hypothetical protein